MSASQQRVIQRGHYKSELRLLVPAVAATTTSSALEAVSWPVVVTVLHNFTENGDSLSWYTDGFGRQRCVEDRGTQRWSLIRGAPDLSNGTASWGITKPHNPEPTDAEVRSVMDRQLQVFTAYESQIEADLLKKITDVKTLFVEMQRDSAAWPALHTALAAPETESKMRSIIEDDSGPLSEWLRLAGVSSQLEFRSDRRFLE